MALHFDYEFVQAMEPYMNVLGNAPKHPIGDIANRRKGGDGLFELIMPAWPSQSDVEQSMTSVTTTDGAKIPVTIFRKSGSNSSESGSDSGPESSAVLYCHGGGYFGLSVKQYSKVLEYLVSKSGVPIFAPDHRLAPEHPFPAAIEDCYACLQWLSKKSQSQNIDPARIVVLGDSAGGGLAAALAIMARDRNLSPPLAKQMLVGSMLDDRSTTSRSYIIDTVATWDTDSNITGWQAYIGADKVAGNDVSPYAAPARVQSVKGLPRTYVEVPDIDIFRDENLKYASRIAAEDIETEVHSWVGVPHSFELFSPHITTTQIALQCRVKAIRGV